MSSFWILLELRMTEVVATTLLQLKDVQSSSQIITTNSAPIKSRMETFWYRLSRVVPENVTVIK